jgi:hypothetical protein
MIACLPKGEIGSNAAAAVTTRIISSFPLIKFGLIIGIEGGVLPAVRLGDVIISIPADGIGGVMQWDLGKAEQGDTFKRTGALESPFTALRTVLIKLKIKYKIRGFIISQYLENLKTNWPLLTAKYIRLESLKDVLFKTDYNHIEKYTIDDEDISDNTEKAEIKDDNKDEEENKEKEKDYINCDRFKIGRRKTRNIRIYYGLITFGN